MAGKAEMALILSLVDEVTKTAKGIKGELEDVGKTGQGLKGILANVGSGLAKIGGAAIAGGIGLAVAGVTALGTAAFATAKEFDEAFDNVVQQTGITGDALESLKADSKAVFGDLPVDIDESASVLGVLAQRLDMSGEAAQELGKRLLMMGTDDATKSAELYTRVMGDWGVASEDSAATLDKMFKASQLTGVGVDDLMTKVVQFGAPLRLMGYSIDEAAAMFGKWEKEGVNAELVMGSLRIAAGKFAKEGVPLQEGLRGTIKEIKTMTDGSEALALGMEIFGARAGPDMVAAIREGRFEIDDLVAAMGDSENAILDTAEATFDFGERMQIMKNRVKTALEPIGATMMDSLGKVVDKVAPMIETTIVPLLEEHVVPAVQKLGDALALFLEGDLGGGLAVLFGEDKAQQIMDIANQVGEFVDKLGGMDVILNTLAIIVGGVLVAAFIAWAVAAWAAVVPLLPIYAAIAAIVAIVALAVAAWQNDWGGIRTFITDLWTNTLQPIFNTMVEWLQTNIPIALEALAGFWTNTLQPAIQAVGDWITGTLIPTLTTIWEWLATNIPAAIETVTGFWENTLLPAIQTVWAWIEENLIPLFIEIGRVLEEVVGLALTALAGLWENVLLPAIQTVWGWINDTLIPMLTTLWEWLSVKLSEALEVLKGWWEKLQPALQTAHEWLSKAADVIGGGLTKAIEKVTGFLSGLTDKLNGLKLPAWLTPGSPTPMENGLRGIAAALGPVVDEMFAFAKSLSGPQAANMKNAASAFKDLAKGIDEIAGAMNKLTSFQAAGGSTDGFGGWLDQFVVIATMAATRIDAVIELIGYDRIHKLKLTAGRLKEIIEAVLVDLSAIKERQLPDLAVWFNQLQDVFQRAVVVMNAIYGKWGMAVIERAAQVAALVGQVLQILGAELGKAVPPPPDYEGILMGFLGGLALAVDLIMPLMSDIWAKFGGPVLSEAVKTVEAVTTIVGVLSLGAVMNDLVKAENLLTTDFGPLIVALLAAMVVAVDLIVPMLEDVRAKWGEVLESSAGVTDAITKALGLLGIDLAKIVPPPINFRAMLVGFLGALDIGVEAIIPMLRDLRAKFGGTVLDEAAETGAALEKTVGVLSLASVFAGLSKPENAIKGNFLTMVTRLLAALSSATDLLVPGLQAIQDKWGAALDKVADIAEIMKRVFSGVADAQKSAVEFTTGGSINLAAFAQRIAALNAASAAAVAGLGAGAPAPAAPVVPVTPGAGAAPAGGLDAAVIRDAIIEGVRGSQLEIELSLVQDPNERAQFSARLGRIERMFAEFVTKWEASNA